MSHADPFDVEGTLGRTGMVIMPARKGTGDPKDLALRVVLPDRRYLLGEPILVHCQLINETESPLVIPYMYADGITNSQMWFTIRTATGERVGPINRQTVDSDGPPPIRIPPGHQFVHTINLAWDYAIVEPGAYDLTAEYISDGNYYEFDRELKKRIARPAWKGRLVADVGRIQVEAPSRDDDRQALQMLLQGVSHYPPHLRYSAVLFSLRREKVIEEFPRCRYSAYIRYNLANVSLSRDKWKHPTLARRALEQLEHLSDFDWDDYPKPFRERVLHRLILAHLGAGSEPEVLAPLVQEFRKEFPDSPYELPEAADNVQPR